MEGYIIPEKYVPKETTKISRTNLESLKQRTEYQLKRKRGVKYRTIAGTEISGKEGAKLQRSQAAKKGWRERREKKKETYDLGYALIDGIQKEIDENRESAQFDRDYDRLNRCRMIQNELNNATSTEDSRNALAQRLAQENGSYVIERVSVALMYTGRPGTLSAMASEALMEVLTLIRDSAIPMDDLIRDFSE